MRLDPGLVHSTAFPMTWTVPGLSIHIPLRGRRSGEAIGLIAAAERTCFLSLSRVDTSYRVGPSLQTPFTKGGLEPQAFDWPTSTSQGTAEAAVHHCTTCPQSSSFQLHLSEFSLPPSYIYAAELWSHLRTTMLAVKGASSSSTSPAPDCSCRGVKESINQGYSIHAFYNPFGACLCVSLGNRLCTATACQ